MKFNVGLERYRYILLVGIFADTKIFAPTYWPPIPIFSFMPITEVFYYKFGRYHRNPGSRYRYIGIYRLTDIYIGPTIIPWNMDKYASGKSNLITLLLKYNFQIQCNSSRNGNT